MDRVPAIGGARGIFDIFVPGAFLLLNIGTAIYLWPVGIDPVRNELINLCTNTTVVVLGSITLGYLFGVVLRLLRCELPDRLSAGFLRLVDRRTYGGETDKNRWAFERFPYTRCMQTVCEQMMLPGVLQFYERVWSSGDSKHFFNLTKLVVASEDQRAAQEVYSAEALCRHLSGMFYALSVSLGAVMTVDVAVWIRRGAPSFVLTSVAIVYLLGVVAILSNYRFMRFKEVETVFAASYRNRSKIEAALRTTSDNGKEQVSHDTLQESGEPVSDDGPLP